MRKALLIALAAAAVGLGSGGWAQERRSFLTPEGSGSVEIRAESLTADREGERLIAEGAVSILWDRYRLHADRVSYRRTDGIAEAEGNVSLEDDEGNVLRAERLTLNLERETGSVEEGELWLADEGYRVWGAHLEKTGPTSYLIKDGGFTACDGTWPSWRIEADSVEVELEKYLVGRGAAFWVEGVPVVYLPYVLFPVKRERQSGFLLPRVGYSDRDGFLVGSRYYWAPVDWADVTAGLDYRSRRGWTESVEVRYVLAEDHYGNAEVTYLRDRVDDSHRYTVQADHWSRFRDGSKFRLHVDYLGDTSYLKDLGETLDERGVERLESYAFATHDANFGTWFGLADYYENLDGSQSDALQTLPSLGLIGRETPLGASGLYFEPNISTTHFWRTEGTRGERLELTPHLAGGLSVGGVGLTARAGYRQNLYSVEDETISRGAADAEVGTEVTLQRRFGGFVHTFQPRVRYRWEGPGRGGDPPIFDDTDVFEKTSEVGFLVENRLLSVADFQPSLEFDVERAYDLLHDRWSPWRVEGGGRVGEVFSWAGDAEYQPTLKDPWLLWSLGGVAESPRGDRLFLGYRYLKNSASYADGGAEVVLHRLVSLLYRHRYDARDSRTLEETLGLRLTHPCWELLFTYSRNLKIDENDYDNRYVVELNLKGLGRVGALGGGAP